MKRTIKAFLVICCLAICLTLCLTACGNKCEHNYDNDCDAICNDCEETREVGAHDWSAATCTASKSCKICGATEGEALGHDWKATDCVSAKTCKTCGATEGEALGHTPADDDGDCSTEVKCTVCGEITTAAKTNHIAHADDNNCLTAVICTACDTVIVEAKTAHDHSSEWLSDGDGHWHVCKNEGCTVTDTKTEHFGGVATCINGKFCEDCGFEYDTAKNPENHASDELTYTDNGNGTHNMLYACCGAVHTEKEACSGGTATCLGYKCVVCGAWYGDTDATNHANTEEFTYTANDDGTIHTGTYNCCGAEVKIETVIEGSTATITISELPTLLMVRSAIEVFMPGIKSININGILNETLQGYVAETLSGFTVDLYLPNMETSELSESLTSEEDNISVHCGYIVENGTYLVYNVEGLSAWGEAARAVISTGTEDTDNDWYAEYTTDMPNLTLAADITLTGENNWTPLGYCVEGGSKDTFYPYIGTIDGNGHTITGLNINSTEDYIAFMGSLGPNSEVKDLTFKDATIIGGNYVATVAADCGGNVTNCHVTGSSSVSGNIRAAGVIAGNADGIISGCTNAAAVTVTVNDVNWGSGGVVGTNANGIVIGCFNSGDITASGSSNTQNCGGVVGLNYNKSTIIACGNTGKVEASVNGVGGIAGGNYGVPVYACWTKETTELSNGEVSNKDGVGVDNNNKSVLKACYSFADTSAVAEAITAMNTAIDEYNASAAEGRKCPYQWQVGTDGYPTLVEID